jgi:hypothetical protein
MKANLECVLRACRAVAHVSWVPSRRARVSRTRWGAEAHVFCVRAASPTSSPRGSRRPQGQGASSCCTSFGRGGTSRRRWRRSARGRLGAQLGLPAREILRQTPLFPFRGCPGLMLALRPAASPDLGPCRSSCFCRPPGQASGPTLRTPGRRYRGPPCGRYEGTSLMQRRQDARTLERKLPERACGVALNDWVELLRVAPQ